LGFDTKPKRHVIGDRWTVNSFPPPPGGIRKHDAFDKAASRADRAAVHVAPNSPSRVRPAAVAGRFYPASAEALQREVNHHLTSAIVTPPNTSPKAIIAPHAGYPYSGPIAGSAFAAWASHPLPARRVVVVGPAHYVDFEGLALSSADAFDTPLGPMPVDAESKRLLLDRGLAHVHDRAHQPEHSLEVELPFLGTTLTGCSIVPLLVGDAAASQVAEALDLLWGGPETVLVVSSDLSHYLDYEAARAVDEETRGLIEELEAQALDATHACGWLAIAGLLLVARNRGLQPRTIDLRNSGDTAGSRDRVVGYGAWWLLPGEPPQGGLQRSQNS